MRKFIAILVCFFIWVFYIMLKGTGTMGGVEVFIFVGILGYMYKKINTETKKFENGDLYKGQLKNNKMNGNGTYIFDNGEKYIGEFKDDKFHGKGKYIYPDGSEEKGEWVDDECIDDNNLKI